MERRVRTNGQNDSPTDKANGRSRASGQQVKRANQQSNGQVHSQTDKPTVKRTSQQLNERYSTIESGLKPQKVLEKQKPNDVGLLFI
ncbi:MAG: hypothetical protein PHR96_01870 [Clostridia bacterium]|nr:hypothetical protein [Clostridia bacterium]